MKKFKIVGVCLFLACGIMQSSAQEVKREHKTPEMRFKEMNTNGDEYLDQKELEKGFAGKTKRNGEAFDAKEFIKTKDTNGDGKLDLSEFSVRRERKGKKR